MIIAEGPLPSRRHPARGHRRRRGASVLGALLAQTFIIAVLLGAALVYRVAVRGERHVYGSYFESGAMRADLQRALEEAEASSSGKLLRCDIEDGFVRLVLLDGDDDDDAQRQALVIEKGHVDDVDTGPIGLAHRARSFLPVSLDPDVLRDIIEDVSSEEGPPIVFATLRRRPTGTTSNGVVVWGIRRAGSEELEAFDPQTGRPAGPSFPVPPDVSAPDDPFVDAPAWLATQLEVQFTEDVLIRRLNVHEDRVDLRIRSPDTATLEEAHRLTRDGWVALDEGTTVDASRRGDDCYVGLDALGLDVMPQAIDLMTSKLGRRAELRRVSFVRDTCGDPVRVFAQSEDHGHVELRQDGAYVRAQKKTSR
ncbi:MAG: hypothetical protein AAF928_13340 [Myxococcota bacterium]